MKIVLYAFYQRCFEHVLPGGGRPFISVLSSSGLFLEFYYTSKQSSVYYSDASAHIWIIVLLGVKYQARKVSINYALQRTNQPVRRKHTDMIHTLSTSCVVYSIRICDAHMCLYKYKQRACALLQLQDTLNYDRRHSRWHIQGFTNEPDYISIMTSYYTWR